MNLDNECPFKDLEVNILKDCARTISDNDNFYNNWNMWINKSILLFRISYLIFVISDSGYKVILKILN